LGGQVVRATWSRFCPEGEEKERKGKFKSDQLRGGKRIEKREVTEKGMEREKRREEGKESGGGHTGKGASNASRRPFWGGTG
jgi:hypothetical protein